MAILILDQEVAKLLSRKLRTQLKVIAGSLAVNVQSMSNKGKSTLIKKLRMKRIKSRDITNFSSGIEFEKSLADDIRGNQKWIDQKSELAYVSFSFPRHGVFYQRGNSRSHGKDKPREKRDWFNATLNANQDAIADVIMEYAADAMLNYSSALIPDKL